MKENELNLKDESIFNQYLEENIKELNNKIQKLQNEIFCLIFNNIPEDKMNGSIDVPVVKRENSDFEILKTQKGKICQEILKHRNRNIPIKKYKCYKEIINDIQEEMRLKNRMFNKTKLQKPDLKRKIELLDELINENLSVNKLALRYGLDPTTFSRYFKSLEKESPENFDRYITYIGNTKYNSRFKHKKGNENYKNMSNKEYKNYIENLQQSLKNKR